MLTRTILLTGIAALAALAAALPTSSSLTPRAGGPAAKPIPSSCTVTDPLPVSSSVTYVPGASTDKALLYAAYYPSPSSNKTAMAEQCLQQCYGYGDNSQCKSAFWAENVAVPPGYYGSPGGQLLTACLMFTRALEGVDFAVAPEGQATDGFAGSIAC